MSLVLLTAQPVALTVAPPAALFSAAMPSYGVCTHVSVLPTQISPR